MKLLIEKSSIEPALRRIIGVVDKRNTIAILSNVMITTQDGKIQLRVTDLDMEAVDVAACAIERPGSITVEAGKLYDIVRNFQPGSNILIELPGDDPRLVVSAGRSRFRLPVLPVSDFPALQAQEWPVQFMVPAGDLARILARSSYAMALNETRYILNGVYLHAVDGHLRAVATDGKRMAYSQIPIGVDVGKSIIPVKMTGEITRRLDGLDGDVMVCVRPGRICLITGDAVVTSKLIDGEYPDYVRTLPTGDPTVIRLDADALVAMVQSAAIVNADKVPAVRLVLAADKITVTCRGGDADAADEMEIDYAGDEIAFRLNSSFLIPALTALNADVIEMLYYGPKMPVVWRKEGDDQSLAATMPMVG